MNDVKFLSICIPTNGVVEWVMPVLDSIYMQSDGKLDLFEVIVSDNGNNENFRDKIKPYLKKYNNLKYFQSREKGFMNQIASFKRAKGRLIKFLNHRLQLLNGTLEKLIEFSKNNDENSNIYYSNGVLKHENKSLVKCADFNDFMLRLSYYSSWSAGLTMWRKDFEKIECNSNGDYNVLFPHFSLLTYDVHKSTYYIDNSRLFMEVPTDDSKKGNYNLFYAFCVEYITLLIKLVEKNYITITTYKDIRKKMKLFIAEQYYLYILKRYASNYNFSNYKFFIGINYSLLEIRFLAVLKYIKKGIGYGKK